MANTYKKIKSTSIAAAAALGTLASLLATLTAAALCTQLQNTMAIEAGALTMISPAVWFVSSLIGSIVTDAVLKKQFLAAAAITGLMYGGILFLMNVVFLDGNYTQIGWGILSIAAGIVPAILLFMKKKTKAKVKFKFR